MCILRGIPELIGGQRPHIPVTALAGLVDRHAEEMVDDPREPETVGTLNRIGYMNIEPNQRGAVHVRADRKSGQSIVGWGTSAACSRRSDWNPMPSTTTVSEENTSVRQLPRKASICGASSGRRIYLNGFYPLVKLDSDILVVRRSRPRRVAATKVPL